MIQINMQNHFCENLLCENSGLVLKTLFFLVTKFLLADLKK